MKNALEHHLDRIKDVFGFYGDLVMKSIELLGQHTKPYPKWRNYDTGSCPEKGGPHPEIHGIKTSS